MPVTDTPLVVPVHILSINIVFCKSCLCDKSLILHVIALCNLIQHRKETLNFIFDTCVEKSLNLQVVFLHAGDYLCFHKNKALNVEKI